MGSQTKELDERKKALKERFIKERGYWSDELWGELIKLDPEFLEAYLNFSAAPYKGPLPPKVRELIYIAIDASTTHLYEPGLRQHIRNALKYGATVEEILEVLEMISALGIHSCTFGIPILMDEIKKYKESSAKTK